MTTPWLSRRTLQVALVVSLALNVGLIGYVAARHLSRPAFHGRGVQGLIERLSDRMPEADAAVLRRVFDSERDNIAALGDALRKAREDVRQAVRAEPFDPGALSAALAEARDSRQALESAVHQAIVQAAREISPEARAQLWRRRR